MQSLSHETRAAGRPAWKRPELPAVCLYPIWLCVAQNADAYRALREKCGPLAGCVVPGNEGDSVDKNILYTVIALMGVVGWLGKWEKEF